MRHLPTQKTSTEIHRLTLLLNPPAVCLQALSLVSSEASSHFYTALQLNIVFIRNALFQPRSLIYTLIHPQIQVWLRFAIKALSILNSFSKIVFFTVCFTEYLYALYFAVSVSCASFFFFTVLYR